MKWSKRSSPTITPPTEPEMPPVRLRLPGWNIAESDDKWALWRDADGDALSFAFAEKMFAADAIASESRLRRFCRALAESRGAGLIEVGASVSKHGRIAKLIYKRLDPHYVFTGMLFMPRRNVSGIWTVVAAERGPSGAREAAVTLKLMNEEGLTVEAYETSWAQDPYEPGYDGVDRATLRCMSDDERFDADYPYHPLSKVRRLLRELPAHITIEEDIFGPPLE